MVVLKLFLQSNISLEKTGQWPTLTLNHSEGSVTCSRMLSVNVCLWNRIPDFVIGTTVRQSFAFLQHFTNRDHQDTSSGDCNDESHLLLFKTHSFIHSIGMCRIWWFLAVLRNFFHFSMLYTLSFHPFPPTSLPSSLTSSCHYFLVYLSALLLPNSYTGCPRRNVPNFGRVFLMLNYTDITQNPYVQSWTVTEIKAREKCGLFAVPRTVPGLRDVIPICCTLSVLV